MAEEEKRAATAADHASSPPNEEKPADSAAAADVAESNENASGEGPVTTVFHDKLNYNVKHPLHRKWTLWFDNPRKKANAQSWSDNLKEIVTFDTVEDYWGVYNNITKVNHLEVNSNYHLFKEGVRPEWEDPENEGGAKFNIQFPKHRTGEMINEYWLNLVLAMIGEQYALDEQVCGAVVSVRKVFYRISLWIKNANEDDKKVQETRRQLEEFLNIPNNTPVEFAPHGDGSKPPKTPVKLSSTAATPVDVGKA